VDHKSGKTLPPAIEGFETRRINFTFRYVPREFIVPFRNLPAPLQKDVRPYMEELGGYAPFFKEALESPN
jgi:hypothetical protein